MKAKWSIPFLAVLFLVISSPVPAETVKGISSADVLFAPRGGLIEAVVQEIDKAGREIVVHSHSFPSYEVAKALAEAQKRGAKVVLLLDRSQKREKESTFYVLEKAGIQVYIDSDHVVANNNVMIIDKDVVITGSFNFTKEAEEKNAENMLIVRSSKAAALFLKNFDRHMAHSMPYRHP
ncbi:MAG: phospholipase D family protein [Syntrophaceae bacterium]|nr:phospholipase D family protein [Syntrophaceae bacterium]